MIIVGSYYIQSFSGVLPGQKCGVDTCGDGVSQAHLTGVWRQSFQRDPWTEPRPSLWPGAKPPKLKTFQLCVRCETEAANSPYYPYFASRRVKPKT